MYGAQSTLAYLRETILLGYFTIDRLPNKMQIVYILVVTLHI